MLTNKKLVIEKSKLRILIDIKASMLNCSKGACNILLLEYKGLNPL